MLSKFKNKTANDAPADDRHSPSDQKLQSSALDAAPTNKPFMPPYREGSVTDKRRSVLHEGIKIEGNWTSDGVVEFGGTITGDLTADILGSKEQAVIVLFSKYCDQAMSQMQSFEEGLPEYPSLHFTLREMTQQFEAMLQMHMSANRAMHEHFQRNLEVHNLTKKIFKRSVDLMKAIQRRFLDADTFSDAGAWYAAQVLVTFDYNYLLRAMPAFPEDHHQRHNLIADFLEMALRK